MSLETSFTDIKLDELMPLANQMRDGGWRALNILCTNTDEGIDVTYSFIRDASIQNYRIKGITKEDDVPSIQELFPGVFPFENEAHDLFGVQITNMAIDFGGAFYQVRTKEPMTIITPEQKAAREKAAKIKAAKAAKAAKVAKEAKAKEAPQANEALEADKVPAQTPKKDEE